MGDLIDFCPGLHQTCLSPPLDPTQRFARQHHHHSMDFKAFTIFGYFPFFMETSKIVSSQSPQLVLKLEAKFAFQCQLWHLGSFQLFFVLLVLFSPPILYYQLHNNQSDHKGLFICQLVLWLLLLAFRTRILR